MDICQEAVLNETRLSKTVNAVSKIIWDCWLIYICYLISDTQKEHDSLQYARHVLDRVLENLASIGNGRKHRIRCNAISLVRIMFPSTAGNPLELFSSTKLVTNLRLKRYITRLKAC